MRADRLISLLMLLQTNGRMTADDLAERLEVSTRTIYRDLDALSASGVPVYAERGPQGGCMLMESYRTNLTGLNENEVRALFMFTVPGLLADLGADKSAEAAMLKLSAALPAPFQKDAQLVQERLFLDPAAWFQPEEPTPYLPMVQQAVFSERRLRMQYRRGDGRWIKRLVDPYGLVAKANVWYVVGSINNWGPKVYRVSRIQEATLSDSRFIRPDNFQLAEYWRKWSAQFEAKQTAVSVRVCVHESGAALVAQVFGEWVFDHLVVSDRNSHVNDASLELTFDSLETACRRILALGTAVTVESPPALREMIRETAVDLAANYSQPRNP